LCTKTDILNTLAYFDVFRYPLTQTEIFFFLQHHYEQEEFIKALYALVRMKQVVKLDEFFSLQDDYSLAARRRKGNQAAKKLLDIANKVAGFLSSFPFVRGVAVSGSLSKNFADENADIDFFIITKKNKLWLARTFMHLFKKLTFLFHKEHLFCMNYYVDEEGLLIKEKNIYTATELATLIPMRGIQAFADLYANNTWSREMLPNYTMKVSYTKEARNTWLKRLVEAFFSNLVGQALDYLLMKITLRRWAQKRAQHRRNVNGNLMGIDGGRHYAKPDPVTFQCRFMATYEQKVFHVLTQYQNQLKPVS
jgi:predicted nucleotidyltransferase